VDHLKRNVLDLERKIVFVDRHHKLLHRILPGAHEVFEIFLRVDRWWGAGHGVPGARISII
jgi:hypothetical protein